MKSPSKILLSSGEMSGDIHAAGLVSELLRRLPSAEIRALAGDQCAAAGADIIFNYRDYAILGFTGVIRNFRKLRRLERALKREIEKADLFIAVDYPGLNLRLCDHAYKHGVPVLYYISPQVWAWGAGRLKKIARTVDRMAVILPFEEDMYRAHGMDAEFVGHPFIVDHELPPILEDERREGIALLPGSREQEVVRVLPALLASAEAMLQQSPDLDFVIGKSPGVEQPVYNDIVKSYSVPVVYDQDAVDVMRRSRLLLVASGTATLQGALMETPLVIVYRVSPLNYWLARHLIKIEDIGLVNVILGERVAPEFVQGNARPDAIATSALKLLGDGPERQAMRARFSGLRDMLGGGRGCARVAEMAEELLSQ